MAPQLSRLAAAVIVIFTALDAAPGVAQRAGRRSQLESTHPITLFEPSSDSSTTTRTSINLAARVSPGLARSATINGTTVPVFSTGVFVQDNQPLQPGENTFTLRIDTGSTQPLERVVHVIRPADEPKHEETTTGPLAIDTRSITPAENVALPAGEDLEVSFTGTPGALAEFQLPGGTWQPMGEAPDTATGRPSGTYRAAVRLAQSSETQSAATSQPVSLRLKAADPSSSTVPVLAQSKGRIQVLAADAPPQLVRVKDDSVGHLAYGLTDVRLGGPYLAELTSGTILRVIGRRGYNLKVQLSPDQVAWIPAYEVEPAAPGTPVPHLDFTDMNTTITAEGDEALLIPYPQHVPFAVRDIISPDASDAAALTIDLYGAHHACTWITHRRPGKIIRQVTIDQVATDHVRVTAALRDPRLWGYKWEVTTGTLKVTLRHAPALQKFVPSPLAGLTVAVEAGHGGSNLGATGITGSREKDITLAVSQALEQQLVEAGARVVQTRIGDESATLGRRAERAMQANADLFVSIHCNSSGTSRGYLATAGNALFYKHPFNHELAASVHQAILDETGLAPFGVVGNFNYAPVRVLTWMPAILVEQAFISNPDEEARLLDPAFQQKMAKGIRRGLENYLK
jgi:N-acetylmuramoyl-L-alanine amidase